MLIELNDILKDKSKREFIADYLRNGKIMVYPTETVYGIGCDAFNEPAIRRTFELKQRSVNKPFIILVKDRAMLEEIAADIPPVAERLMKRFWPGPLTIIFRTRPNISKLLTANTGKIGTRQSPYPLIESIFTVYDHPVVSTSANISDRMPATCISDLPTNITDKIDLIIDGGKISSTPSTVIDVTGNAIRYVREGIIKNSTIERFLYDRDKSI